MGAVVERVDLRSRVWDAVDLVCRSYLSQNIIKAGPDALEVDWSPQTTYHPSQLLPLVLLTVAVDQGAAASRWSRTKFVEVIGTAHRLDGGQKDQLLALAGIEPPQTPDRFAWRWGNFAHELSAWIHRYQLDGHAVTVDWDRLDSGRRDAHFAVRPIVPMAEMPAVLKRLPQVQAIAALVVLALYDEIGANAALMRRTRINPPVVDALAILRDDTEAFDNMLRLVAAYRGW